MAKVILENVTLTVNCDCGGKFLAEDFEPQCPYCDRMYSASIPLKLNKHGFKISSIKKAPQKLFPLKKKKTYTQNVRSLSLLKISGLLGQNINDVSVAQHISRRLSQEQSLNSREPQFSNAKTCGKPC